MTGPAEQLLDLLVSGGRTVAVAESVTGGAVCAALVKVPGASRAVRGAVVAYATDLKTSVLGVDGELLATHGAVDPAVAAAMAEGVRRVLGADMGLATTGVAGPEPADGHRVGTVFIAVSDAETTQTRALTLSGDRDRIREATVDAVLRLACQIGGAPGDISDGSLILDR